MIKKIYGEENGLTLKTDENDIFLRPSKKKVLTVYAENSSEYDMHLYLSFTCPNVLKIDKKEFDVFVPAQGNSRFEISLFISDDERFFFGSSVLEFSVKDKVLEQTWGYEIPVFTENTFACGEPFDFSPKSEILFSSKGEIFIGENENLLLEGVSFCDEEIIAEITDGENPVFFLDNEPINNVITLKKGSFKLCIKSSSSCRIILKQKANDSLVCLNTVNPKFFL